MSRPALALALAGLALLPSAAIAKPRVCSSDANQRAVIAAGKLTQDDFDNGVGVNLVRCGDITDDAHSDALFTISSGGTAGDTRFGVLRGRANGSPGRLVLYKAAYKVGVARRNDHSFEVLQPHYDRGDPNCCPSSFRLTRYTWTGSRFRAGEAKKLATAPARFYRP